MRGGAYKIFISETRKTCSLPKGLFPGNPRGEGAYSSFRWRFGQKFLRAPLCKRSIINVNWLFHHLFENTAFLHFPYLLAYQSVTH